MKKPTFRILLRFFSFLSFGVLILVVLWNNRSPGSLAPQPNRPALLAPIRSNGDFGDPSTSLSSAGELDAALKIGFATRMDVSPPLREIAPLPVEPFATIREIGQPGENEQLKSIDPQVEVIDPVLQSSFSGNQPETIFPLAPAPALNFEGVNNRNGVYPPDTNGDAGPNHYVQMVNLSFQIWNKNGVSLYGPANNNTIWSGFGVPCETRNDGDPIVLYDQLADRWILSQFTAASPYGECIAISTSGDPTGSYYRYFFQFSTTQFYDYPKLGVWTDGYYLTANRFTSTFQGASAVALERDKMLLGQTARYIEFQTSSFYASLLPADLDGSTLPPSGAPNYMLDLDSNVLHLWKYKVNWNNPGASTFSGPQTLTTASFNWLCPSTRSCIPQPGTSIKLDDIGDRLMHRLAYRNFGTHESLVANHSVDVDNTTDVKAGLRWYEIRNPNGTPTIYQQGTYSPDDEHRWMGSLAMDRKGNIGLVYSVSSGSVYPSIRYTGRLVGDPLGQLPQGETTLITGSGSQTGTASRWGDYAMIAVDPVDDCAFWITTQYLPTTGTAPWSTRIGKFTFSACLDGGTLQGQVTDQQSGLALPGALVQAQGPANSPALQYETTANSQGQYQFANLPIGSYTVIASQPGYYSTQVNNVVINSSQSTSQNFALQPYPYKLFTPLILRSIAP